MNKVFKDKKLLIIFMLILLIGLFFRIYKLHSNPPELFSDEIVNVLSARNILETGIDIDGKLNLFFYNRVESRSPVYGYLAAISTYIFGKNTFAIRFPAALLGTFSIVLVFLIAYKLKQNIYAAIFSSLILAIIPWQIHYSRVGWEPAATIPFFLLSIYLFLKSGSNKQLILPAYISFAMTIFTHRSGEIWAPVFLILLSIFYFKTIKQHFKIHLVGFIFFVLAILLLVNSSLKDPGLHGRSLRIFTFNKGVTLENIKTFSRNYMEHFSPQFLFTRGDRNLRHGTGENGVLYFSLLPLILVGLISLLTRFKNRTSLLLICWLLIFPLGGSLTNDGVPHATRTLIGAPLFAILGGVGFGEIVRIFKNKGNKKTFLRNTFFSLLFLALILELFSFSEIYFNKYPQRSSTYWNYGNSEIFKYLNENRHEIQDVCLETASYWDIETLTHYYLPENKMQIIIGANDLICRRRGATLVLMNSEGRIDCQTKKIIQKLDSDHIIEICSVL